MDVCVVTYRNTAARVVPGLRAHDTLWVRDNTFDNVGFARAANELASKGTDSLILFANPDGDPQPDCFDQLEEEFTDPLVVAAAARSSATGDEQRLDFLVGACLAVRRHAFEAVGGFDESFFMYGEDVDLSWKLASRGRLVLSDQAVFVHQGNNSWMAHYRRVRNGLCLERRWGRPPRVRLLARRGLGMIRHAQFRKGTAHIAGVVSYLVHRDLPSS